MGDNKRTPLGRALGGVLLVFSIATWFFLMRFSRVRSGEELDLYFTKTDKLHGWYILGFLMVVLFGLFGLIVWHEKQAERKRQD
jgi:hypothetical protein